METCKICGRLLDVERDWNGMIIGMKCPKHGDKFMVAPAKKEKRGKYSGKSKSENAFNDYK